MRRVRACRGPGTPRSVAIELPQSGTFRAFRNVRAQVLQDLLLGLGDGERRARGPGRSGRGGVHLAHHRHRVERLVGGVITRSTPSSSTLSSASVTSAAISISASRRGRARSSRSRPIPAGQALVCHGSTLSARKRGPAAAGRQHYGVAEDAEEGDPMGEPSGTSGAGDAVRQRRRLPPWSRRPHPAAPAPVRRRLIRPRRPAARRLPGARGRARPRGSRRGTRSTGRRSTSGPRHRRRPAPDGPGADPALR